MGDYRLELADAHEFIKTLPDAFVDAVISDPPYHTTQLAFDALEVRWGELWPEIYRVCKPSAVQVMFSAQPFTTDLINSNRKRFRYELIWPKRTITGFLDANARPLRSHENVCVFSAIGLNSNNVGKLTYNSQRTKSDAKGIIKRQGSASHYGRPRATSSVDEGTRHPRTVLPDFGLDPKGVHPTQKPLELLCYLIKTYTNPNDTVLDLFSGSGTTGHACLLTGRKFIGCEIGEHYHAVASKRLAAVEAQSSLFAPTT